MAKFKRTILIAGVVLWGAMAAGGLTILMRYEFGAGVAAAAPASWPGEKLPEEQKTQKRGTLIVFVHPQCPCSAATINELARLVAVTEKQLAFRVVFSVPDEEPAGWEKGRLWESAGEIPGVERVVDRGQVMTRQFHAETSGQAMLYDNQGHLIFSGGLTVSRGHEGDNLGRTQITEWALGMSVAPLTNTAVYGCALGNETTNRVDGGKPCPMPQ